MPTYQPRYPGDRWSIAYGRYDGIEKVAVNELQRAVQAYLPYVLKVQPAADCLNQNDHLILVGTAADNPWIREVTNKGMLAIPDPAESYAIMSTNSPWQAGRKLIVIAGRDETGALYGVHDFCARTMAELPPDNPTPERMRAAFDGIGPFTATESPAIASRGIWSWGYTIYDYRRFLDHMARLRMNTLIVWNDVPPANMQDVLDYAHDRGVRVICGFPWGWGMDFDLSSADDRRQIREMVVEHYRRYYQHLNIDGLYTQTLTEHSHAEMKGKSTAHWACELANDVIRALRAESPDLYIQLGLHATSIQDRLADLQPLDKSVPIVWEDAGVLPFTYTPVTQIAESPFTRPGEPDTFERTLAYSRQLATFRPGPEFAMIAKGWTCLRWGVEDEHHAEFILGEQQPSFIQRRLEGRQALWDRVNALWFEHYPLAMRFYREILEYKPTKMLVTGLIEDGAFEACIQPSVALFAETLWNPRLTAEEILRRALSPYLRT